MKGLSMYLHFRPYTADGFVINELFTQDCYLSGLINPGMQVVDIGAHIGCFSALALERGAEVIAYEPDPDNFELLRLNCPKADKVNKAILFDPVDTNLTYRLSRGQFNTGGGYVNDTQGVEIQVESFGSLVYQTPIDYLKIDIEGGEVGLLQHPEFLVSKYLALETHNNLFGQFYNFLSDQRYRFLKVDQQGELGLIVAVKL